MCLISRIFDLVEIDRKSGGDLREIASIFIPENIPGAQGPEEIWHSGWNIHPPDKSAGRIILEYIPDKDTGIYSRDPADWRNSASLER